VIEQLSEWLAKIGTLRKAAKKIAGGDEMRMRAGCRLYKEKGGSAALFVTNFTYRWPVAPFSA